MKEQLSGDVLPVKRKRRWVGMLLLVFAVILTVFICLFWSVFGAATSVRTLEDGFYAMNYRGNYDFDDFLEQGGASTDLAVADFAIERMFHGMVNLNLQGRSFGCSTLSVASPSGERLFGRNFDWGSCAALVVQTDPPDGYASISTVNMDFLDVGLNLSEEASVRLLSAAAPYAPMDGMNEQGLCVAVLMIEDSTAFAQNAGKPDLTTTTAVRLLLDKAATVDEAITLLEQYDMHASMGMMVHYALADAGGRSVVVEYIDNEMIVTETPVVTNFYLAPGERYGIGTEESHIRYELLTERLTENNVMEMDDVRDALDRVSKHNFDSVFASTEWSTVYNQSTGEVQYYHREDYTKPYHFSIS